MQVVVYTDGSYKKSRSQGGYAFVVEIDGEITYKCATGILNTTNNRMEMSALIAALNYLKKNNIFETLVVSDSEYVINSIQEKWLDKWIETDFNGGIKNKDLWIKINDIIKDFKLTFQWVKGHNGNPGNEMVDSLAQMAAESDLL